MINSDETTCLQRGGTVTRNGYVIQLYKLIWLICLLVGLVACGQVPAPSPEAAETAEVAVILAEPTLTPTASLTPTPTLTPEPTIAPTFTPTAAPTETPTPTPTAVPLTISQPANNSTLELGSELLLSGQIQPERVETLVFTLEVAALPVVTGTIPVDTNSGLWQTMLGIPLEVTGAGQLMVQTADGSQTATVAVDLVPDGDATGLTLTRPLTGETAVAGHILFLEGRVRGPVDDTITFGVLIDNCTTYIAGQTLSVTGGAWRGVLILPLEFSGPACAVATTGSKEGEVWREARAAFTILSPDDPASTLLTIGNPIGTMLHAGQPAVIYGLAVHAPDNQVRVVIALDNGQRTVLAEGVAVVDGFGYWEIALNLPAQTGAAVIVVSMGQGETYTELTATTTIAP